jgi:protein-tyrosine phosphatase
LPNRFIDTHCHGIPQVDDGVQSDESALMLLTQAVESKTALIFMTPHVIYNGKFFPSKELLEKKLAALREHALLNHLDIELKLSCEIMMNEDGLKYIQSQDFWGYQETNYVLIEFMPPFDEVLITESLYELHRQGKRVIIAHPERYFSDPKLAIKTVRHWKSLGAYFQVNKTSLFSGPKASTRSVALALLEHNLIALVASDAHHAPGRREARLDQAHTELIRLFDESTADLLVMSNPKALSQNKALSDTSVSQSWLCTHLRHHRFKKTP